MSKRYYEHEDRYSGKKFYSDDPYDSRGKGNSIDYEPSPILMTITATAVLIMCPFVLRIAHLFCFRDEFSWIGLTFYVIILAILYGVIGWIFGAHLVAENFEDEGAVIAAMSIAYIISLIVIFFIPSSEPPFLKWYDYVMSGVFAYILTKGVDE